MLLELHLEAEVALLKVGEEELRRVSAAIVLLAMLTGCCRSQIRSGGDTDCWNRIDHLPMICWNHHLPMDLLLLLRRIDAPQAV